MSAPLSWTPAVNVIGAATAEVTLTPSQGGMRSARVFSFDRETKIEDTAVALSQCFREVRVDPPRGFHEIAQDLWASLDARERPKPG